MRLASWLLCASVLSACGGSGSPASPSSATANRCVPQTAQCVIDGATLGITLNGIDVPAGSTQSVASVSSFSLRFSYSSTTGQPLWLGFLFVRDDGVGLFTGCIGLSAIINVATVTLFANIPPNDPLFTSGRTVSARLVAMSGGPTPSGQCALRTSTGEFDPLLVQGQRLLLTFAVQ